MQNLYLLLAGLIGYFCGAIPFGYLFVKWTKGINILEVGSGRTGGTNSYRAAGLWTGVFTALADVFKGFMAVWLTRTLLGAELGPQWLPWASVVAGVMSVVGHNWSIFLGWRGGAGTGPERRLGHGHLAAHFPHQLDCHDRHAGWPGHGLRGLVDHGRRHPRFFLYTLFVGRARL